MRSVFFVFMDLVVVGCGTDLKPTAFIDIVRDPGDIDSLNTFLKTLL